MFDRRLITHFDWPLLLLIVLTALIGIANLFSATSSWSPWQHRSISNRFTG